MRLTLWIIFVIVCIRLLFYWDKKSKKMTDPKYRVLKNGKRVTELEEAKTLTVHTKCPEKWLLIDQETGEHYIGYATEGKNSWQKINNGQTDS